MSPLYLFSLSSPHSDSPPVFVSHWADWGGWGAAQSRLLSRWHHHPHLYLYTLALLYNAHCTHAPQSGNICVKTFDHSYLKDINCVTIQLSYHCHAHYSQLSDNHWYNVDTVWINQRIVTTINPGSIIGHIFTIMNSLSCERTEVRTGRVSSPDWGMPAQGQRGLRGRVRPAFQISVKKLYTYFQSHNCFRTVHLPFFHHNDFKNVALTHILHSVYDNNIQDLFCTVESCQ